jgi:enamine deaminase RidA (YjgF/YER057c/UK114 family)
LSPVSGTDEGIMMKRTAVNPWSWQDKFGFTHAWRVEGAQAVVFLAGQGPVSPEGEVVGATFEDQARATFENLRTVLEQAGASFDAVVKLTTYLTDVSNLRDYARVRNEFITGDAPASTVVGVTALALPGMTIEIDAWAVL